jgi:hypothetical protein
MEKLPQETREQKSLPEGHEAPLAVDLMEQIHEKEESSIIGEGTAQKLAEQVGISQEKAQDVLDRPDFQENLQALEKKRTELGKTFRKNIIRALGPILGLGSPESAMAKQSPVEVVAVDEEYEEEKTDEEIAKERKEQAEKLSGELFDRESPLTYRSEKLPLTEYLPEDLDLLKGLQVDALEKAEEQATISGRGNFGDGTEEYPYYISTRITLGKSGGSFAGIELPANLDTDQEVYISHTHPLKARLEYLRQGNKEEKDRPYIMPPSMVDIGSCFNVATLMNVRHRVVDTRGVWEFKCSPSDLLGQKWALLNAMSLSINNPEIEYLSDRLGTGQQNLTELYGIDMNKLQADFKQETASEGARVRYPVPPNREAAQAVDEIVEFVLGYGNKQFQFLRDSADASPEENQRMIKELVDFASQHGLEMAYTPFKKNN